MAVAPQKVRCRMYAEEDEEEGDSDFQPAN